MTVQSPPAVEQNASHSAALFRQAWTAPFTSGGILASGELAVSQQASPNMSVQLGAGRCVIPGTSVSPPSGLSFTTQGSYFALNDATVSLTIAASNPTNPRIDAVYMQAQDSFYTGSTNLAVAGVVTGTPAATPSAPAIPVNSLLIAYVAVAANASSIVNANISQQTTVAAVLGIAAANAAVAAVGSKLIVPTTVTPVTGTAAISALGSVTFTGVSTLTVNGAFPAGVDQVDFYLDIPTVSAALTVGFNFTQSGTPVSSSNYDSQVSSATGSSTGAAQALALTTWNISNGGTTLHNFLIKLIRPNSATAKVAFLESGDFQNPMTTSAVLSFRLLQMRSAVACDGFILTFTGGLATGVVRMEAHNNG